MAASVASVIAVVVTVIRAWHGMQDPSLDVQAAAYARAHYESYSLVQQQLARGKSVILMLGTLAGLIQIAYGVMILRVMRLP